MQSSFLEYAYSVIYSRALPDARDGLKPVQRRILYQMTEMGLRPDKGHVKSSRVVGDVMGRLHPHGDASIYDALVRLAQDFTLRLPLIDGHGNFGSLDDGPAAPRYTEARLAGAALAMTDNLEEDVVELVPNYDNQLTQPEVLPAAIPNLLVNGASGIAVGMATNMAPHNLVEIVQGAQHLLMNPQATVEELMEFIPGPDLPGGGTIVGLDGVKDAYRSGRGAFRTRATAKVEALTPRKNGLIITELPYLVGPERIIEKIKEGVEAKKLSGITDVIDLTDMKNGLRLVISVKAGFDPEAVLEQLYRYTPLEDSFSINNVALVEGQPQTLGLKELLTVFIEHRISVITRRTRYRLARRRERLHLVDGLLVAILDIDEVIQLIRSSNDSEGARQRLMEVFDLSQIQAEYILELRLRRLTKFSRIELEAERDDLLAQIAELEKILGSKRRIREVVSEELDVVAEKFGTPRRTLLRGAAPARVSSAQAKKANLELVDTPCTVLLSVTGRVLRIDDAQESPAGTLKKAPRRLKHDAVLSAIRTTSRSEVGAVTTAGRLIRFTPMDVPTVPGASIQFAAGVPLSDYLGVLAAHERVLLITPLTDETVLALGTKQGVVKRVGLNDLPVKPEYDMISLKEGDSVVGATITEDNDDLVFVTSDAQLLRFSAQTVRPQGRQAGGMAGIKLGASANVIFFTSVPAASTESAIVVTVADSSTTLPGTAIGSGKVSEFSSYPSKGRATGGVRTQRFLKGEDQLTAAWVGSGEPRALGADYSPRTLPTDMTRRDASGSFVDGEVSFIGTSVRTALGDTDEPQES
ncbi:DNA topoisomerase IV subunit A [Lysinibacter sp. HNR]|uniref:DNA gyrase/topoisomerase IV subunit A n=1 Tax=Lysinibacter sp. HNR TaxID=3031408 RepID=UPI00243602CB|nr:DNA topoisomerase IV subunit A [Lysinibacter sp. HNR]WGD38628.1 DNA topoisomerase IV subunit A [Lysinibacter sp. HNR]